jgi:hypothetical protein
LPDSKNAKAIVKLDSNNNILYDGEISSEVNNSLFRLFDRAEIKPSKIIINSEGGDVYAGMDLGMWIRKQNLFLVVDRGCASSCANYVFTAARKKALKKYSVLIWHGNSFQESIDELVNEDLDYAVEWRVREEAFFREIGVDYNVCIAGFKQISFWDELKAFFTQRPIAGFDYSLEDMQRFGIENISLLDGEWNWRQYANQYNVIRATYTASK